MAQDTQVPDLLQSEPYLAEMLSETEFKTRMLMDNNEIPVSKVDFDSPPVTLRVVELPPRRHG